MHQSQHAGPYSQNTQSGPPSHLSEISHAHQPISMSQHMTCLQPLSGGHVGGRLHMMVSLFDRFCFIKQGERFCNSICLPKSVVRPTYSCRFASYLYLVRSQYFLTFRHNYEIK
ncbi:hypothetical protein V8G54_000646 [Vigna mungo]|uniref:Uncharacterized protein n=1 Tax=Vigna mungo TaxID=3915 RepID=A0AAQ3P7G6_VIGMU